MPKPEDVYPIGSIVRLKKTNEFAKIIGHAYLMQHTFLHYESHIDGRDNSRGHWPLYHDEIELEHLPPDTKKPG